MLVNQQEKYKLKKTLKRRMLTLLLSIPFGVGFAMLFYICNLSFALQLFLTVVCWGTVFLLIEMLIYYFGKAMANKNKNKPKKIDPFAD
ncbi:MAG: hypothetical protein J5779_00885 [Clostridia bacterium]|nr:hypothetical protein [Clostridia bacterium]